MGTKNKVVYATAQGELAFDPDLEAVGATGEEFWELTAADLIPLPAGSTLFYLPGRAPLGLSAQGEVETIAEQGVTAVAAILPQGYTRLFLPAYQRAATAPRLPLFGYTAVAYKDDRLWVAARCTDELKKWNPQFYNSPDLPRLVQEKLARYPENRILKQLGHCAQAYHCFTAQNIFYGRWEGGIPVSPACNAQCLGCISKQVSECCPSPQERIGFQPTVAEVVEIALPHLTTEEAIISFGQGCEGEPLLAGAVIKEAITLLRQKTKAGTININTNAGLPDVLEELALAGLNTARVSLFSADPKYYRFYHQPRGYGLNQVGEALRRLHRHGVFVSLNLLTLPGFTDRQSQMERLFAFLHQYPVGMIQIRNLNIDPDYLWAKMRRELKTPPGAIMGIDGFLTELRKEFPELIVGNYSRFREEPSV
ncbi:MAG TPA: radical SAM protein [Firmicutes bacterium]|jgi:pyruvate-formate lyase-activating enzyme|nr:radical SAM protein [Bacillota bacterium]